MRLMRLIINLTFVFIVWKILNQFQIEQFVQCRIINIVGGGITNRNKNEEEENTSTLCDGI